MYSLTHLGEPIGLPEYCTDIAAGHNTHAILMLDWDTTNYIEVKQENIIPQPNFHELVLESRS